MGGPLAGIRVIELVGLGPGPFAGMLLADLGAEVLRVDRLPDPDRVDFGVPAGSALNRGKRSVGLDLKQPAGRGAALQLVDAADALVDPFRPGVTERLGLGPQECLARNPRLVYGRLTGYGQDGPLATRAGHDIDYIALAGALEPLGRAGQPPTPPINVLADFAGGGLLLAYGIACAFVERATSGQGQVVDAAMIDGAALLMAPFFAGRANGAWGPRGTNSLDTGSHFYEVYETADDRWLAVGAIEPQFYAELLRCMGLDDEDPAELLRCMGLDDEDPAEQWRKDLWPAKKARFATVFRTKTRDEWCTLLEQVDACVAPVLDPVEAPSHPHHVARGAFLADGDGVPQPAPAPRFSRTPAVVPAPPAGGQDLEGWGFTQAQVDSLHAEGVMARGVMG